MTDQPLAHLPRVVPPWEDPRYTDCGRKIVDVAKMGTRDEYAKLVKRVGQRRADYDYCITCVSRNQHGSMSWDKTPADIVSEWVGRSRFVRDTDQRDEITMRLYAIEAVIAAHRDEYEAHIAAQGSTLSLAQARAAKAAQAPKGHLRRL